MSELSCTWRGYCPALAIVASIIIGIVTAMLTFMGTITITPAFSWVLFGIAVVYLGILLITSNGSFPGRTSRCACSSLKTLLWGILGTVLFSVTLLGITFAATSVIGAVFAGLLLAFFTLTLTSTVCLIKCRTNCDED
ncbi:MAG: hypothetical protein IKU65_02815 [Oscillospiraceae bacterium]|nr:hypothetical protein [Oscillospiraceae bacterium]